MQICISIHDTPKEVWDALNLEVEKPISGDSDTRWKKIDVGNGVEITFFKAHNQNACTCGRDGDRRTWAHDTDCPQR